MCIPYILFLRIPLIPWREPSAGNTESENRSRQQKRKDKNSENEVTACRNYENLIIDTWQTAVTAVSDMVWNVLLTLRFLDCTVRAPPFSRQSKHIIFALCISISYVLLYR